MCYNLMNRSTKRKGHIQYAICSALKIFSDWHALPFKESIASSGPQFMACLWVTKCSDRWFTTKSNKYNLMSSTRLFLGVDKLVYCISKHSSLQLLRPYCTLICQLNTYIHENCHFPQYRTFPKLHHPATLNRPDLFWFGKQNQVVPG